MSHTSYLSQSPHVSCGEKSVRFLFMANGEKSEKCSGISDSCTWKMWRIVKSWQLNCGEFLISPHDRCKKFKVSLFCCKISWLAVYAVLPWNLFCCDLRAFCVEKNCSQKCAMWRKNDKYDVWDQITPCASKFTNFTDRNRKYQLSDWTFLAANSNK